MPKKDYVHVCIVLDASGSMECIEDDIKGSFNTFMAEQKNEEGKTVFDVFQFADRVKRIVEHADMAEYKGDLMSSYRCNGMTALHDAVCTAIDALTASLAQGDKVQISGFGTFEVKDREARVGRNPHTKETIDIPATKVPVFKASKALKDTVAK